MHTLRAFIGMGLLTLAVGCGGSSPTSSLSPDSGVQQGTGTGGQPGTGLGQGGAMGLGGGLGTGVGGSMGGTTAPSGSCTLPSCLSGITTCIPSGTCVEQVDTTTFASNICYSNGVKEISTLDAASGSLAVTVKQGSTTCYSIVVPLSSATGAGSETFTVKNASGQTIATGTSDSAGNTVVTCTGGTPVTIASTCSFGGASSTSPTTSCTQGTCTP